GRIGHTQSEERTGHRPGEQDRARTGQGSRQHTALPGLGSRSQPRGAARCTDRCPVA
ncbi:hypothetical protein NDU88_010378, partial [Pleurodeles waltl]